MNFQTNWIALQTIINKEYVRMTRIWIQTLIPPVITMSLYFIIFGRLVGSRVGEMGGFDYIQFIVPGLVMMSVITNSYNNVVSSFYSAKFQKYIEELIISPVHPAIIVFGFTLGGVLRGLIIGTLVTIVSLLFTTLPIYNIMIIILVVLLTSFLFSLCGFTNALFAKSFDDISMVPTFILTPLTYMGGVFYSIDMLPPFWKTMSAANPILYMVNAFRYGFLGITDINIWIAFGIILVFCVVFFILNVILMIRGYGIRN
ncbi:ABC transporter permease [Leptospira sp. GIMC2001]|uniref:ABC transporter permease n=1 Tax=Leptospira sp. GIMC2001 TaxID=1513297 RepID=UPI00234A1318|nr:ABC transporter permease [Leptospira sp. GIMC2001]WCL51144.1 ABC transporter permease [Leptospira sp. GIMC2001]